MSLNSVLEYLANFSLGDFFEVLTFIGFGIFIFRCFILRKPPVPSGKKVSHDFLEQCVAKLRKQARRTYGIYRVPADIYERLQTNLCDEKNLKRLLCSICSHLGINGNFIKLVVVDVFASDRAGQIATDLAFTTITLEMKQGYTPEVVIAILAHEAIHLHLYYEGIHYSDTWENEILTDTAAVYCGFGEYMYHGYGVLRGNFAMSYQKVGYIRQEDVKYIQSIIRM